jgi:tol-pal system protein YbgF
VTSTGCLATKADVRLLQDEIRAMRTASAQADTARRAQSDSLIASATRTTDSLRALSARVGRFQADVNGELYAFGRQLITIQELSGQSQNQIQRLRADLESRSTMPAPAPAASDSAPAASGGAPALPGPNALYQAAKDQLDRGSPGAARAALDELLRAYPTAEIAPTAQFFVGETYAQESMRAEADSVYQLVVRRYPKSDRAPTALYKQALSQRAQGRTATARALFDRLVREYPRSDEATLAREQLRATR